MDESTIIEEAAVIVADDELVEDELLVEEISIDGMCGVY
jgi:mycofactocin precursor